MRKPYRCSSMMCEPPKEHCLKCSHATFRGQGTVLGRTYRWEFEPMWGPRFLKKGEYDWLPHHRHVAWKAFEKWCRRLLG
jgi:hypothetical protein